MCVKDYETDMRALRATLVFHAVVFMMHSKELLKLTEGERENRSMLHTQQSAKTHFIALKQMLMTLHTSL